MRTSIPLKEVMMAVAMGMSVGAVPAGTLEDRHLALEDLTRRDNANPKVEDEEESEDTSDDEDGYSSDDEDDEKEEEEEKKEKEKEKEKEKASKDALDPPQANPGTFPGTPAIETDNARNYEISPKPTGSATPSATTGAEFASSAQTITPTVGSTQHQAHHRLVLGLGITGGLILGAMLCVFAFMMYLKHKKRLPARYDPFKLFGRRNTDPALPPNGFWVEPSEKGGMTSNNGYTPRLDLDETRTEMMQSDATTLFGGKYSARNDRGVVTKPVRAAGDRSSHSSQDSNRSMRIPLGGNTLPRHPSAYRKERVGSNPFSDVNAVEEAREGVASPLTIARGTGSLRSVRTLRREPSIRVDSMKSPNPLMLSDPRVKDGRTLVVANQSQSPMPSPVAPLKFPKRAVHQQNGSISSRSSSGAPQISRFSWTTKAETPLVDAAPPTSRDRRSRISAASEDSQPQFRTIQSWVAHQNKHVKKRLEKDIDEESEAWAKSIADYDRKSVNSGWDTRRTMTEY